MIYELRTYDLRPGTTQRYLELSAKHGRRIRGDDYGRQEGFWFAESGSLDRLVSLWSYPDLAERQRLRSLLAKNEAWTKEYLPLIQPLLSTQVNRILLPLGAITPPASGEHAYELRFVRVQVGRVKEWSEALSPVLPILAKHMHQVGAWQTEIGVLHETMTLWALARGVDRALAWRQIEREPLWQSHLERLQDIVAATETTLLSPATFSAMK